MNMVLFMVILAAIFLIAVFTDGVTGVFVALLCGVCFICGLLVYRDIVVDKTKNAELMEVDGKYYEIKYVKDKAE
ncbi:hypothetical protein [Mannheimia massilioguelmaensis]|uniref:hypothetical protein n=1 Tax=Mannheimia massilioguelmaensis TaxID=1604354 RepID=UPI0005C87F3D|nr:hypothetical protein [Mannheimia massilioguelmaensis]